MSMQQSRWFVGCLALSAVGLGLGQASAAAAPEAKEQEASVEGWDAMLDNLRSLDEHMLAKLSPEQRRDPQLRQEVGRLMLESLAAQSLRAISDDSEHPVFLPALNLTLNVGQPNSDTIYKAAVIAPGGVYRIRGRKGSLRIAKIGQFSPAEKSFASRATTYHDLNLLKADADGRYEVILSPERPAGYTGDWWKLDAGTTRLMLRQVASDWKNEQDPTISIVRLDTPALNPRREAADLERRLRDLPDRTAATGLAFVDHVEQLRQEGFENKLKVADIVSVGGLFGQFYYEGAYSLRDDEALILEAKVPAKCAYYSTILTNDIWETTDWINNQSSLNDSQSKVDPDGVLRIVISNRDPGVPNWLATAGYPKGVVQGRWTDCSEQPIPSVKVVKLAEVRKNLPKSTATVSPAERENTFRDRNEAYQQRIFW